MRDRFSFKVRLQIPIDNLASVVSAEISCVSLYICINRFTDRCDIERWISLLLHQVYLRTGCLVVVEGQHILMISHRFNTQ